MKLEDIGFYTLSDKRAKNCSASSPLKRCEIILLEKCNFKCPYCRGLRKDISETMPIEKARNVVKKMASQGLENIRFSGGEPTIYPEFIELVKFTKKNTPTLKHLAISTNGSAKTDFYLNLEKAGVNDFSISLDACCSSDAKKMSGKAANWKNIVNNIEALSKIAYVTVGVVVNENNINELNNIVEFASGLGVSDIRIISSAQYNQLLEAAKMISDEILEKHPILKYRVHNIKAGRNVRGLKKKDSNCCSLVLDDIMVAGNYHFPCVIYMREYGDPIGKITDSIEKIREDRLKWCVNTNIKEDSICNRNCLDVCIDHNNKVEKYLQKEVL